VSRWWITETAFSTGWDAEAVLLTRASYIDDASADFAYRRGTDHTWNMVLGTKTGTVITTYGIDTETAVLTIYDPITMEVIATPTVTIDDDGDAANDGKFSFAFADTDTPTPGQWAFTIVFTVGGLLYDRVKGWIDILPAVPT
jgi:hypothetical protein